jgi:uncharacterized membrane protein
MATMLGFIALLALLSHLAPELTRRDIFFGVTVAPGFRDGPAARLVSRRYWREIWLLALVAAALVVSSRAPLLSVPMLPAQALGASVAFARAHRALLPHAATPATLREAEIGPRPSLPGGLVGQLGPFVILLAAAAYVGLHWDEVPVRFPTHWNIAGQPNGWTNKSVAGVYSGLWVGLIACAVMFAGSYGVLHGTRLPRVTGEDGHQNRRVRQVNLFAMLASEYLVALLLAWTTVVSMFSGAAGRLRLPLALRIAPFAVILVGTLAVIRLRQRAAGPEGPPIGDTTPDSCWIWGQFYYNRADPALFVEKRMGLGYTLNLGNRLSWLFVILTILALSVPVLLVG